MRAPIRDVKTAKALRALLTRRASSFAVVEYEASWCQPCKEFRPRVEKAADAFGERFRFFRFDTDKDEKGTVQKELGLGSIRGLPTVVVYRTGKCPEEIRRLVGCATQADLDRMLEQL